MTNRDLKNQAYHTLREKLINCEYKPGSLLNEARLSEELGISRTPVREALTRIEQEGFIRILPKKGIYVTDILLNDVLQIFQVRYELEPVALKMAAPSLPREELLRFRQQFAGEEPDVRVGYRLDTAMHLFLIEHCGNRYLIDLMCRVFDDNTRVIISSKQNEIKIHDARLEHLGILDLLLEQRFDEAQEAMRTHILSCKKAALDFFYTMENPSYQPQRSYRDHLKASELVLQARD